MIFNSLKLALVMILALAFVGCGGDKKYYLPADSQLKPFQAPDEEDLIEEEDEDDEEVEDEYDDEEETDGAAPAGTASKAAPTNKSASKGKAASKK